MVKIFTIKQETEICFTIRKWYNQKESVINILKENKNYKNIEAVKDLAGNDRVVLAKIV